MSVIVKLHSSHYDLSSFGTGHPLHGFLIHGTNRSGCPSDSPGGRSSLTGESRGLCG